MRTLSRSQTGRQAVAALYVLATLLFGLASSTHGVSIHDSSPNDSRRQSETGVTATSTPAIDCHGATERGGGSAGTHASCCDACALSAAPGSARVPFPISFTSSKFRRVLRSRRCSAANSTADPPIYVRARPRARIKVEKLRAGAAPSALSMPQTAFRRPGASRVRCFGARGRKRHSDHAPDRRNHIPSARVAPIREGTTMAFIDSIFRRVSHPGDAFPGDQVDSQASAPRKISAPAKRKKHSGGGFYYWNFFIHKWAGLIGAAWLAALGLTGFFLDHDSWRWLMQNKSPAFLTPAALDANSAHGVARYLQIDPSDRSIQVAGGPRGLWLSRDGGTTWMATRFLDGDHPQILAIEPDPAVGWNLLWFASDNGVYVSDDKGATARQTTLKASMSPRSPRDRLRTNCSPSSTSQKSCGSRRKTPPGSTRSNSDRLDPNHA